MAFLKQHPRGTTLTGIAKISGLKNALSAAKKLQQAGLSLWRKNTANRCPRKAKKWLRSTNKNCPTSN
jgi:hypothetical protein